MHPKNLVIVAAAGSGKTTHLVKKAAELSPSRVLITTFTRANVQEIREKFFASAGSIPPHVQIFTWFQFLLRHGIKPYQEPILSRSIRGVCFVNEQSVPWERESNWLHYSTPSGMVYSDKLSKLTIKCDERNDGKVFRRIEKIFDHIFIDEFQDLAGYDLDIIKKMLSTKSNIMLVGDPRQALLQTHAEKRNSQYAGKAFVFLEKECNGQFLLDEETLAFSHRNSHMICDISSQLYPEFGPSKACSCSGCRGHTPAHSGLFLVRKSDVEDYLQKYDAAQLRHNKKTEGVAGRQIINFGNSKGRTFDHVLIYPTKNMLEWLSCRKTRLQPKTCASFYVAMTRAKHSVAFVVKDNSKVLPDGFEFFGPDL